MLGNNMFAYCGNNPIVRDDSGGQKWKYTIEESSTEAEENEDGSFTVTTTITYSGNETIFFFSRGNQ